MTGFKFTQPRTTKMSFINLLANDVWSDADIVNRTEAMIRSEFSVQAETIMNRKLLGEATGSYTLNDDEKAELVRFKTAVFNAQVAGVEARRDMELLKKVFELEAADQRLKKPVVEPVTETVDENTIVVNQTEIDADTAEREAAQAKLDAATEEEMNLFSLRNPVPVVETINEQPIE